MNLKEMMQALLDGKTLQHLCGNPSFTIKLVDDNLSCDNDRDTIVSVFHYPQNWKEIKLMTLADLKPGQFSKVSSTNKWHPGKTAFCFGLGREAKVTFIEEPSWISPVNHDTCKNFECELIKNPFK